MEPKFEKVGVTYSKDPAGVIFVVCNAAVAHSALCHDRVETLVREGEAAAAGWRLATRNEGVDGSVSPVFLLNLGVSPAAVEEEGTTTNSTQNNETDDNANCNAYCVRLVARVCVIGCCSGGRSLITSVQSRKHTKVQDHGGTHQNSC